jgi:glucose/arabinose dehydrogenase
MRGVTRRRFLALTTAGVGLSTAGCVTALGGPDLEGRPTVAFEPVATGFTAPLGFEAPTGVEPRYVVDQAGTVEVLADAEADEGARARIRETPFLDVTDRTVDVGGYTEAGLLGLAFHPDFPEDDRCFVRYSAPPRPGTPSGYHHTFVLASFRATPDRADTDTERTLLEIPEPQSNHNSGSLVFGPDGYLYVGVGDGGAGGDRGRGHVEDWYDGVAGGNGQDVTDNLLGSVLRLDVDADEDPYGIPGDNPLVGREGLDEHYAWGLRNPWGMSFDGDRLLVADVGQNEYEEVDAIEAGGNYGWNVKEGTRCFGASTCPDRTPDGRPLLDPVVEYSHDLGIAVVGGYVYRGSAVPALAGRYVFGDWRGDDGPTLFAASPESDDGLWSMESLSLSTEGNGDGDDGPRQYLHAFGRDREGELLVCTGARPGVGGSSGAVHRIRPADDASTTGGGGTATTRDTRDGDAPTTKPPTATTPGERATATTADGDQQSTPWFGLVAGLLGLAGAVGYRRWRRSK